MLELAQTLHRGLFDAIRASIAIPTVFRPHTLGGRRLIDGALLNPVPVTPLIREDADYLFAVSVDGPTLTAAPGDAPLETSRERNGYRQRIGDFIGRMIPHGEARPAVPGAFELLTQSMDLMQANLSRLRLAAYEPDLLIQLPRNMASVYEFYRASELIERGREQTREALAHWPRGVAPVRDP